MSLSAQRIVRNLTAVRQRIADAARSSGRSADEISLVAVTKYVDVATTRMLVKAGCSTLGESRPQMLWQKAEQLSDLSKIKWHLIGHMQRNKVARTLPIISTLQSVDSVRLLQAIDEHSAKLAKTTSILLEVNISRDDNKHGFALDEVPSVVRSMTTYNYVSLKGVMGMASRKGGIDRARRDFAELRELRDSLRNDCPGNSSLDEISMGMSGDFEVAIEEGATTVRVGSALFAE